MFIIRFFKKEIMTYTKRDIVRRISEQMDVPMVQVEPWVDAVIASPARYYDGGQSNLPH